MPIEEEAAANDGSALPESVIADLREDDRRRRVLTCLAESERALPVSDLARRVAAAEESGLVEDVSADAADELRREIFQRHLPKLTATGVVRYDSLVGTVELAVDDERLIEGGVGAEDADTAAEIDDDHDTTDDDGDDVPD